VVGDEGASTNSLDKAAFELTRDSANPGLFRSENFGEQNLIIRHIT
jgi:hypothetical protein